MTKETKKFYINLEEKHCHPGNKNVYTYVRRETGRNIKYNQMYKEELKMNFKGVGAIFCLIAAILGGVRYIAAAICMAGSPTISAEIFEVALLSVGTLPMIAAIVALVLGVCFLILGFAKDGKKA